MKYEIGQNAEAAGQGSCLLYGCMVFIPFLGTYLVAKNREMIREQRDIEVTSYFEFRVIQKYIISRLTLDLWDWSHTKLPDP